MKKYLLLLMLGFFCSVYAQNVNDFTDLKGDYLGQNPPGDTPVVFAKGVVSDDFQQHGAPSFSSDGNVVFWQTNQAPKTKDGAWISNSMTMRCIGGVWTKPEVSLYKSMPFFSTNGKRIYFSDNEKGLCYVEKKGKSWSEPKIIDIVARYPELKYIHFPSISRKGTIYFMGYAAGQWQDLGIYRSELKKGKYVKPVLLPPSINLQGGFRNWAPFIAPDESFLIFCSTRGLSKNDQGDLHICFRQSNGSWSEPMNMGAPINTKQMERFSSLSPDGKYLFFTRDVLPGYWEDVFWVKATIIDKLREKK